MKCLIKRYGREKRLEYTAVEDLLHEIRTAANILIKQPHKSHKVVFQFSG
jgi:hypothetical protein